MFKWFRNYSVPYIERFFWDFEYAEKFSIFLAVILNIWMQIEYINVYHLVGSMSPNTFWNAVKIIFLFQPFRKIVTDTIIHLCVFS